MQHMFSSVAGAGSEWRVFEEYFKDDVVLPITEILVELHLYEMPTEWGNREEGITYFFKQMSRLGYRTANSEVNYRSSPNFDNCLDVIEFTFVKVTEDGHLLDRTAAQHRLVSRS